jgi:hypothetical protein
MGKRPPSPWLAFVKTQMNLPKNAGKLLKDVLKNIDKAEYEIFKKTFNPLKHSSTTKKTKKKHDRKGHRGSKKHGGKGHRGSKRQRGGNKESQDNPNKDGNPKTSEGPQVIPSAGVTNDGSGDNNMKGAPSPSQLALISGTSSSSSPPQGGGKKSKKNKKSKKSKKSKKK